MNVKLRNEDQRAVDLILDRTVKAAGNGNGAHHPVYASTDASIAERIGHAQRLLDLLEWMPNSDPPPDLAARTLRFIEHSAHHPTTTPSLPQLIDSQRPHA